MEDVKYLGRILDEALCKGSRGFEDVVSHSEPRVWRVMSQDWGASNQLLINRDAMTVQMAIGWCMSSQVVSVQSSTPQEVPHMCLAQKESYLRRPTESSEML